MSHPALSRDDLLALQCTVLTLAGPGDEVLCVEPVDASVELAVKLTRTRLRRVARDDVFDAIGEHTRALLLTDPSEEALELSAFDLPLILLLSPAWKKVELTMVRVEVRLSNTGTEVFSEGLSPHAAAELGRWMEAVPKGPLR